MHHEARHPRSRAASGVAQGGSAAGGQSMRGNTRHHAISRSFTSPARDDHIAALSESPPAAGGTEFSKEPRDVEPNGDGGDASVSDACAEVVA